MTSGSPARLQALRLYCRFSALESAFPRSFPEGAFPPGGLRFGEPLIFRFLGALILGYSPDRQDMIAHPIAMAAWVGLLATSLNLLPIWQLDGGHIAYAILGRSRQRQFSMAGLAFSDIVEPVETGELRPISSLPYCF